MNVPNASLRRVWRDTVIGDSAWNAPIYEEFFRAVREVNRHLPRQQQLRIILGDPPATGEQRGTAEDRDVYHKEWIRQRDSYAEDVIRREVLTRKSEPC